MSSKVSRTPKNTINKTEKAQAASKSDKKLTPTTKSPLRLRNLCSVTPNSKATPTKTEVEETNAQMEARIRCQLRLEMLVRMREMQDYYESKIADLTEQMDNESPTLSAIKDIGNAIDVETAKNQEEIEKLKQEIADLQSSNLELEKQLQAQKEKNIESTKEIENAQIVNSKLIEQKNGLQMRVDALKKKRQEDELKEQAEKEELLRKQAMEKEIEEEAYKQKENTNKEQTQQKSASKNQKTANGSKLTPKSQSRIDNKNTTKTSALSKKGKENANENQNSGKASSMKSIKQNMPNVSNQNKGNSFSNQNKQKSEKTNLNSNGMNELNKPPYRMKITPHLAHKAKNAK